MIDIKLEEQVFTRLQAFARPLIDTPNDVIERLLSEKESSSRAALAGQGASDPSLAAKHTSYVEVGQLRSLIDRQLVRSGDRVEHLRARTGEVFEATITAGGCLQINGAPRLFKAPSPALRHFVGNQINGWKEWVHVESQRSLKDLRDNG